MFLHNLYGIKSSFYLLRNEVRELLFKKKLKHPEFSSRFVSFGLHILLRREKFFALLYFSGMPLIHLLLINFLFHPLCTLFTLYFVSSSEDE